MSGAPFYTEMANRATELLGDGQWHPYEQVLNALMPLVPPGLALRKSEQERLASLQTRKKEAKPRTRPRTTEELIRSGQRSVARSFLQNKGVFEADRPGSHHIGGNHGRNIRMIGRHRLAQAGTVVEQRQQLIDENTELRAKLRHNERTITGLRDQVAVLREYLHRLGEGPAAERLLRDAPLPRLTIEVAHEHA